MTPVDANWDIVDLSCEVQPVTKSKFGFMLNVPYSAGGAVVDDELIILDVVFKHKTPASRYGAFLCAKEEHALEAYMDRHNTPKRKVWRKSKAPSTYVFVEHGVEDEYRYKAVKRKVTDANLASRIAGAYGQTLYAALCSKDIDRSKVFYNIIRGVEIDVISYNELADILKSIDPDDLRKLKKALEVKKLSIKTLYENIKEQ